MHKRWITFVSFLILLSAVAVFSTHTKAVHADSPQAFISRLTPDVKTVSNKYNLYGSLMAQAACESAWVRANWPLYTILGSKVHITVNR